MAHLLGPVALAAVHGLLLGVTPANAWPAGDHLPWMSRVEATRTVTVRRPLTTVAAYLAHLGNVPQWHPDVALCVGPVEAVDQVGARWRTVSALGAAGSYRLVRRRPHWITLVGDMAGIVETIEFALTDLGRSTEVHATWRHQVSGVRAIRTGGSRRVQRLVDDAAAALRSAGSDPLRPNSAG